MKEKGFTVIELMVVIAVITVVTITSFVMISKLNAKSSFNNAKTIITSTLQESRNKAVTGYGTSDQGVLINSNELVLFEGSSYSGTGTTVYLPPAISLSAPGTTVVFKRITGKANTATNFILSNSAGSSTISISSNGSITAQ